MIIFNANSRRAVCLSDDPITTGSVGIEVRFALSEEWAGLSRVAVFRGSGLSVDVTLSGDSCTVPPELLAKPDGELLIGLYGTDGSGACAIPTVWASAGRILRGAIPSGVTPSPAQQSALDQAIDALNDAREGIPDQISDALANSDFFNTAAWVDTDGEPVEQTGEPGTFTPRGLLSLPPYFTPRIFDFSLAADGTVTGPIWEDVVSVESSSIIYADMTTPQGYTQRLICVLKQDADAAHDLTIVFMGLAADGDVLMLRSHPVLDIDHINSWVYEKRSGGGGSVTVDSALSDSSENPVQNKVVKAAVDGKYTKPATGIPKTDLASDVQDAIDNAIQDPVGFHEGNVLTQTSSGGVSTESWEQVHDIPVIAELSVDANDNLSVSEDTTVYRSIGTPYTWQGKQPAVRLTWPDGTERTLILTSFNSGKAYWFACSSDDTDYALGLLYVSKTRKWMWTYSHSVKYAKPATGIPATDLADEVQTSLRKADTALQQHQSLSGYATEQWVQNQGYLTQHQSLANYQAKSITDTGNYFTTDTVEGALQEIGAELSGINTLIGSGVIT